MIEKFIEEYAKLLSSEPEKISVSKEQKGATFFEITIYASSSDAGKLIGKEGKMINAIKTLISGCKAKDGNSYKIVVKSI